jgi:hypothetical protein
MNETDKKLIQAFVDNKEMFDAVRRILLAGMIGADFDRKNWVWNIDKSLSDAAYGKEVKLTRKAIEWITGGFDEMLKYRSSNPQPSPINMAR